MARNARTQDAGVSRTTEGRIVPRSLVQEMESSFLDYSMSVIVQRALPDVRDGLKPVHRRILYAMSQLGLSPGSPYKKSATVVGDVLGKYHPHGDSAVYDALVRLAQDFSLHEPLIDGQGNFGSIDGDGAAAYRYTEARLTPAAMELLADIDRGTVDFRPNFDDRHEEPVVLPARLPNLLLNGSEGIAVGMATNIPPHNLKELAAAIDLLCDRPDASDSEVISRIHGPDFPTGGLLLQEPGIDEFYRTGRGRMRIRAKTHIERGRNGRTAIVVTEIPYGVVKSRILTAISDLVRDYKPDKQGRGPAWPEWIADLRDESDRDGIRIVIELKKGVDAARVLANLFKKTPLEVTFGGIMIALVDGAPRLLSLREALEVFIRHRLDVVVRRARHDLAEAERRAHVLEGLLIAVRNIERVIQIIKKSADRAEASSKLQKTLKLSERQAEAILDLRLARLTALDVTELKQELESKRALILELQKLLSDPEAQRRVVRDETREMARRFGRPRRTQIVSAEDATEVALVKAEENLSLVFQADGVVRISAETGRKGRRGRGADVLSIGVHAADTVSLFTDRGRVFALTAEEVPAGAIHGVPLRTIVNGFEANERVIAVVGPQDLQRSGSVVFVTRNGYVKRTRINEYENPRSGGIAALVLPDDDRVLAVLPVTGGEHLLLATREAKAIRFDVDDVPMQGRMARGVIGIKLGAGDRVVSASVVAEDVLALTGAGYVKRVPARAFPVQRRAGQGVMVARLTPKSGGLVCAASVPEGGSILVVAESGAVVGPLDPREAPAMERAAVGQPLVSVPEGFVPAWTAVAGKAGGDSGDKR